MQHVHACTHTHNQAQTQTEHPGTGNTCTCTRAHTQYTYSGRRVCHCNLSITAIRSFQLTPGPIELPIKHSAYKISYCSMAIWGLPIIEQHLASLPLESSNLLSPPGKLLNPWFIRMRYCGEIYLSCQLSDSVTVDGRQILLMFSRLRVASLLCLFHVVLYANIKLPYTETLLHVSVLDGSMGNSVLGKSSASDFCLTNQDVLDRDIVTSSLTLAFGCIGSVSPDR